jgi:heme oxygenase
MVSHSIVNNRFASRLRAASRDAHVAAEQSPVMQRLLHGRISRVTYLGLLCELSAIYGALEEELDRHAAHPALVGIALEPLRRRHRIELDIAALGSEATRCSPCHRATDDYVKRVRAVGASDPALLVAHAYVRYLGDLSGGQILRGRVAAALGLHDEQGVAFYAFPLIGDIAAFKNSFRDAIDAAATVVPPEAIIREALLSFALHQQLFAELESTEAQGQ